MDKVTNISVHFKGKKKRAKKIEFHVKQLSQIFDVKHQVLTPEDFNKYERMAWDLIDTLGYKEVTTGSINVNYGINEDGILSIELLPKQKKLIMRG
jgi:hypothetical protein